MVPRPPIPSLVGAKEMEERGRIRQAQEFLESLLRDGAARRVVEVEHQANAKGIKTPTLKLAKKRLGIRSIKKMGWWEWQWPQA